MHIIRPILLLLGIVVLGILVYRIGGGPIFETLAQLRWWQFVIICLPYALGTVVDTLGWRFAFAATGPRSCTCWAPDWLGRR